MSAPFDFAAIAAPVTTPVAISLFGNWQIVINGKAVEALRLNKSRALLAYLLVEGGRPHLRTHLAALLWPGYTAPSARSSLRQALGDLRNLLDPFDLLHTTHRHVELRIASPLLWCDAQEIQALLTSPQPQEQPALTAGLMDRARLQQALTLAQGGFLANFPPTDSPPFEAWRQQRQQDFADQLAAAQSALATVIQRPSNLGPALTSLIGRATALAELAQKVAHPTYRCLTLTGPGGVGKTRLAWALGQQMQADFVDGVWFVELAAMSQPAISPASDLPPITPLAATEWVVDQIATAIGQTLGIKFQAGVHPSAEVTKYLRDKQLLLILDNFEQLTDGVDWLLTLLATAPQVRLVVTSRHRLPMQAQLVYAVEGLAVPPLAEIATLASTSVTDYASVQLFLERATHAQLPLARDAATLAIIGQICRLVAGLPLAIELAVAMLESQSPAALLRALRDNYRALRSDWRDLPPRQRSAEAVLRSAWRLLTPSEADLLARCAVFRGGFTGAALQAIGAMAPDDLQALLHKSLIHTVGADRFVLHELVRQFAAEQLAQLPAVQATVQERHATYYLNFAQRQEKALRCDFAAQEAIHGALDNLRAAWQWSAARGELALLTQGAPSLFTFYRLTGLYHEAIQQLESAGVTLRWRHATVIDTVSTTDPTAALAQGLLARLSVLAADFYRRTGALVTSAQAATEALTLGRRLADPALQGAALHELARLAQVRGDFRAMQSLAEAGCTQAALAGKGDPLADCLNAVGWALYSQQHPVAAIPSFQAALAALADAPNVHLEGRIRANLGQSYLAIHAYDLAQHHFAAALALQQRLRDQEEILLTRFMLGELWTAVGDYDAAGAEFTQANNLLQLTANPYWVCWLQLRYGQWQQRTGDFTGAQMTLTLARQSAQQSENRVFEHAALLELGALFLAQEQWAAAQRWYEQSLTLQPEPVHVHGADAPAGLARCALAAGQPAAAVAYVDRALELLAQHGVAAARDLFQLYWCCLSVLQATADPRADDLLRTATERLHQDAAQLADETQRHRFLTAVPAHRALLALNTASA
jgi:predicted ATPase/DNA-binding SARP family transcriptional activator/Tfp pilus assembly protein PilF